MMCDRVCKSCKVKLPMSSFSEYKKRNGENGTRSICKRCTYARDSKKSFKKKKVVDQFVDNIMFGLTGKDY